MVLFLKSLTQNVSRHDTGWPVSSLKKIDTIWYNDSKEWEKEMVLFLKSWTQNVSRHDTGQPVSSLKKIDTIWYNILVTMREGNSSLSQF